MADEMMLENVPWESDEAEDSESDEGILEAEDSAEDIGERARRRRFGGQAGRRGGPFRPIHGARGIRIRRPDGRVGNVPFPKALATAAETNRGLASQEVARRALDERLDRLETRVRAQQRNDTSAAGVVSLLLGGGLSAWGAFEASKQSTGSTLGNWASQNSTRMAAVTSLSQIATSGAKAAMNGRYHHSGLAIAADAFAAAQLAAFAFGSLYQPKSVTGGFADLQKLRDAVDHKSVKAGDRYVLDNGDLYDIFLDEGGNLRIRRVFS